MTIHQRFDTDGNTICRIEYCINSATHEAKWNDDWFRECYQHGLETLAVAANTGYWQPRRTFREITPGDDSGVVTLASQVQALVKVHRAHKAMQRARRVKFQQWLAFRQTVYVGWLWWREKPRKNI